MYFYGGVNVMLLYSGDVMLTHCGDVMVVQVIYSDVIV